MDAVGAEIDSDDRQSRQQYEQHSCADQKQQHERCAGDDRPGRYLLDLLEQVVDPGEGGHAAQLEQDEQQGDPAKPARDADDSLHGATLGP